MHLYIRISQGPVCCHVEELLFILSAPLKTKWQKNKLLLQITQTKCLLKKSEYRNQS